MKKTKLIFTSIFTLLIIFIFSSCKNVEEVSERDNFIKDGNYTGAYWPTSGWRSCTPGEVGMDRERLKQVYDYVENPAINTEGIIIIRNGYIVAEAYFGNFSENSKHGSFSVAKSFIGALIGIAIHNGIIPGINEKIFNYFPLWQTPSTDVRKKNITIKHLLTMSSGLEWNETEYYNDTSQNDVFIMAEEDDFIEYVLNKPSEFEPGALWSYSSGDSMLLSGIIQESSGVTAYQFAKQYLLDPIGSPGISWENDPAGHTVGGWGIGATVREYAKFGYLYLNKGKWEENQVVQESWVDLSLTPVSNSINFYGFQWWLGPALEGFDNSVIPNDLFLAWGIFSQQIFVIPSLDLVIVRVANDPNSPEWDEVQFLTLIINSIQ